MNAKLRKTMNIAAAAIFVIGLAINVQMSLDDPFGIVNEVVLAQNTTTAGGDYVCTDWCQTAAGWTCILVNPDTRKEQRCTSMRKKSDGGTS